VPRVSREQSDQNRIAITRASARLFRQHGIKGVSVADLMAAAGLTHGGFYGHFASKDALAAEACSAAFARSIARWRRRVADAGDAAAAREAIVDAFLSAKSRAHPGSSCPTVALAGDVAREPARAPVRAAFAAGVQDLIGILATLEGGADAGADRRRALADLATMVGALLLARATAGQSLSDAFLAAARDRLHATGGAQEH
jgi:TetR/AcrR family transcriptional repressor of nem operon